MISLWIFGTTTGFEVQRIGPDMPVPIPQEWISLPPELELNSRGVIGISRRVVDGITATWIGYYRTVYEIGYKRRGGCYGCGIWIIDQLIDADIIIPVLLRIADQISAAAITNGQFIKRIADINPPISPSSSEATSIAKGILPQNQNGIKYQANMIAYIKSFDEIIRVINWSLNSEEASNFRAVYIGEPTEITKESNNIMQFCALSDVYLYLFADQKKQLLQTLKLFEDTKNENNLLAEKNNYLISKLEIEKSNYEAIKNKSNALNEELVEKKKKLDLLSKEIKLKESMNQQLYTKNNNTTELSNGHTTRNINYDGQISAKKKSKQEAAVVEDKLQAIIGNKGKTKNVSENKLHQNNLKLFSVTILIVVLSIVGLILWILWGNIDFLSSNTASSSFDDTSKKISNADKYDYNTDEMGHKKFNIKDMFNDKKNSDKRLGGDKKLHQSEVEINDIASSSESDIINNEDKSISSQQNNSLNTFNSNDYANRPDIIKHFETVPDDLKSISSTIEEIIDKDLNNHLSTERDVKCGKSDDVPRYKIVCKIVSAKASKNNGSRKQIGKVCERNRIDQKVTTDCTEIIFNLPTPDEKRYAELYKKLCELKDKSKTEISTQNDSIITVAFECLNSEYSTPPDNKLR